MYVIVPELPLPIDRLLPILGFKREIRFRTKKPFWHLSNKTSMLNSIFTDTLIMVMEKSR